VEKDQGNNLYDIEREKSNETQTGIEYKFVIGIEYRYWKGLKEKYEKKNSKADTDKRIEVFFKNIYISV
jgi:hypothetical protein